LFLCVTYGCIYTYTKRRKTGGGKSETQRGNGGEKGRKKAKKESKRERKNE